MEKDISLISEQEKQAFVTSLRLLSATPKSRKFLQKRLEERGFRSEVVVKVLNQLEKQGLMNDRSLAQSLFQTMVTQRPSGRKRIAFELERKGIDSALIHELLQKYGPEEERERAIHLARQKLDRWQRLDQMKRRKKTYDFLVRRGFDFSLSREVVNEVESGSD